MPQDRLLLRFIDDFDGSGKLLAEVISAGFSGCGAAYFKVDEIVELAESLGTYPLPEAARLCIAGGFYKNDGSGQLEQELLALKVYPIDRRGHIGIQVRLSSELWPGMRAESQMAVKAEIVTTYEPLAQFGRQLKALVRGSATEAILVGEEI
jgi:hypothetical protein